MKVEKGAVTILRITEVPGLDPIRVTLDDIEPGKGRINIECYGKAWASYWGAIGDQTIAEFVVSCDNCYLISNLSPGLYKSHFTNEALIALCKRTIRARRKRTQEAMREFDSLTQAEAGWLMGLLDELSCCTSESACWGKQELLESIFGEDGVRTATQAEESNPDYAYLARICDSVREALRLDSGVAKGEAS